MIISLIVAMDENRGIGHKNNIPWHLSDDLKHFKTLTMGHHLIMGRKTFESIGRQLLGRTMIVITRNMKYLGEGAMIAHSLQEALNLAEERGESEVFVIGGAEIFDQAIAIADSIYLTQVHTSGKADAFFPEFDEGNWLERNTSRHEADDKNEYSFTFRYLVRKSQNKP